MILIEAGKAGATKYSVRRTCLDADEAERVRRSFAANLPPEYRVRVRNVSNQPGEPVPASEAPK